MNIDIPWGTSKVNSIGKNRCSLMVTIPKALTRVKGISNGDEIEFRTMPDGTIIIKKIERPRKVP